MTGHCELQEDERLDLGNVQLKEVLGEDEESEGLDYADKSEHGRYGKDPAHLPSHGVRFQPGVIITDRDNGQVVQEREHYDHHRGDRIDVEEDHSERDEEHDTYRLYDAIDGVTVHPLEYPAGSLHRLHDHRKAGCGQDKRGCCPRCVGCPAHCDAHVGLFQGGGIVDAVTGHSDDVSALLEGGDDIELIFRKDLREPVGSLHLGVDFRREDVLVVVPLAFATLLAEELFGSANGGTHAETSADLFGDRGVVTGDHLDFDTVALCVADRLIGIVTRRIVERQEAEKAPALPVVARDAEGSEAVGPQIVDSLGCDCCDITAPLTEGKDDLRRAFCNAEGLPVRGTDMRLGALPHRVEGDVALRLDSRQGVPVFHRRENRIVDSIPIVAFGGKGGRNDEILRSCRSHRLGLSQRERILGKSTGLVAAQDIDTGHLLDGNKSRHNRLHLRERLRPDCHCHGEHRRHRDRNRRYDENQRELKQPQGVGAANEHNGEQYDGEAEAQVDKVVADRHNGFLEV